MTRNINTLLLTDMRNILNCMLRGWMSGGSHFFLLIQIWGERRVANRCLPWYSVICVHESTWERGLQVPLESGFHCKCFGVWYADRLLWIGEVNQRKSISIDLNFACRTYLSQSSRLCKLMQLLVYFRRLACRELFLLKKRYRFWRVVPSKFDNTSALILRYAKHWNVSYPFFSGRRNFWFRFHPVRWSRFNSLHVFSNSVGIFFLLLTIFVGLVWL